MKYLTKIITTIFLTLILVSCSNEEEKLPANLQNESEINQTNKSFDIEDIRQANKSELQLISDFKAEIKTSNKSKFKTDGKFGQPEVVHYKNLSGKAIVLNFSDEEQKNNSDKSLILVVSNENEIITNYEHEKVDNGNSYTIKTYKEGIEWFIAEVDKNTEEIISFNFSSNVNSKMGFWECAEMAVGACVDDGECAFMCGIVWQSCLGAIGLACAYAAI